jgi:hypothetical protein
VVGLFRVGAIGNFIYPPEYQRRILHLLEECKDEL